jgi:hypothetical protein
MTLRREQEESLTNRLGEWIESVPRNSAYVDMASAAAAGGGLSATGLLVLKASTLGRINPMDFSDLASLMLITTIPYLVAALVIHWFWTKPLRHWIPSWVMIALLGSLFIVLSAGALSFYTKAGAWSESAMIYTTLEAFIADKAKDGLGVFVALSIFTLPIAGAVYYAGSIVRAVRRWHNDSEKPPSILENH